MTSETQIIETILERDVDLILLEELNTSDSFTKWFVNLLELPELTEINGTWRSISDFGLGETDLLLSYKSNEKTVLVLIENKLDANFQELQFERYQRRGELYKSDGKCSDYYSILVAPNQYSERQNDFDKYITYEDLRDYFELEGNKRSSFKASLLQIAIEKLKRGYQPINSEAVQKFWQSYWKYKEETLPEFMMKKPTTFLLRVTGYN
jgi:PD-(D/E)XK nuclease superfamily